MRRIPIRDFKVSVKQAVHLEVNASLYVGRVMHLASPPIPGPVLPPMPQATPTETETKTKP